MSSCVLRLSPCCIQSTSPTGIAPKVTPPSLVVFLGYSFPPSRTNYALIVPPEPKQIRDNGVAGDVKFPLNEMLQSARLVEFNMLGRNHQLEDSSVAVPSTIANIVAPILRTVLLLRSQARLSRNSMDTHETIRATPNAGAWECRRGHYRHVSASLFRVRIYSPR